MLFARFYCGNTGTNIVFLFRLDKQVILKGLLVPLGFKVTRSLSGGEGLELMRSRDHLPDLILLDVEMPNDPGYEVSHSISRPFEP